MPILQTDGGLDFFLGELTERFGWEWAQVVLPAPNLIVHEDNMGWSGWEKFRNLTPNDKTNLQEQE